MISMHGQAPRQAGGQPAVQTVAPATPYACAASAPASLQAVWQALEAIPDPEIPVVNIRELGILRGVQAQDDGSFTVYITPTYSGCPAVGQIEDDILQALRTLGVAARVERQLAPAWTTDWIGPEAREKLRAYGIAPPAQFSHLCTENDKNIVYFKSRQIAINTDVKRGIKQELFPKIACPQCGSFNTIETSHFASTACKALYKCLACREPFDYFKPY